MEKIKIFACSEASEGFTKEICDYLKLPYGKNERMKFKMIITLCKYLKQ